jgi:general secretion pathway protein C
MLDAPWSKRFAGANLIIVAALIGADLGGVLRRVIPPFVAPAPIAAPPAAAAPRAAAPDRHQMPHAPPSAVAPVVRSRAPAEASRAPERRSRWHPLGDTRFVPELQGGRTVGLRLRGVGDDSLFAKLGLREGDRLDSVGGHRVTNAREMIALYTRVRSLDVLKLLIERDGQPLEIKINLR